LLGFARDRTTFQHRLVYLLWFVLLCCPQWWVAQGLGFMPALKIVTALVAVLAAVVLFKPQKGEWLVGLALWVAIAAVNMPFTYNRGMALGPFKQLIIYYLIGLCVIRTVRSPRTTIPLLLTLCVIQYLWWGAWGMKTGGVIWHPDFSNFDGYGPLMASGVGPAYFYAQGAAKPGRRTMALLAAAVCVAGVISSFARGAVLSLLITLVYIWARSPRKGRTAGFMAVAALLIAVVGSVISGKTRGVDTQASFWKEMSTMFDDSEGSTGNDRKVMWGAAVTVWAHRPVFGAGGDNFGAAAVTMLSVGDIGGQYASNPGTLYGRALHNIYFQVLSEYGLAGLLCFLYLLYKFWHNSWRLSRPAADVAWRAAGGTDDIRKVSLGLESGMVAYMCYGMFYNTLFIMVGFSLLFMNAVLMSIVADASARIARAPQPPPAAPAAPSRRAPQGFAPARA
jgi:O-antigen ligase